MTPLSGFVQRLGPQLLHNGDPFPIVGTNTYYLAYVEESTLIGALDLAVSFGMNVLRTWAFLDTEKAPGPGEVSFQYWDAATKAPRLQDGENGLVRLDRAIAQAGERGIRLILTLTNNWPDFGGMPRYVEWFGMAGKKNHFYTDQRCRTAYQNYVRELVTRRNTITGRLYSDEPAILAWELANESRCEDFLDGTEKLLGWVDEMSRYIRGLDSNHLIAVGDEGYLGMYGVNSEKLLEIEHIDFGTFHMYPDSMAKDQDAEEWGLDWIRKHSNLANQAGKPMLLEEYGIKAATANELEVRNRIFASWLKAVEALEIVGDLVWMTGLPKSAGQPYDPDGYVIESIDRAPAIREHVGRVLPESRASAG